MAFFSLVILGLVQGLTEFLPVSSSGHLVLLSRVFGIEDSLFVSIILHVATLLSVLTVLRSELWALVRHPFSPYSRKVIYATIPTCFIVLILYPFITDVFEGAILPICFLLTAILLLFTDFFAKKNSLKPLSNKHALIMGALQGLATLPGISRSGSTIAAGVLSGGNREEVAKFSFIMSIPIIILSLILEIYKLSTSQTAINVNVLGLIVGFICAYIVGVVSIKFMIKLTQKLNFKYFAIYLVLIAIVAAIV